MIETDIYKKDFNCPNCGYDLTEHINNDQNIIDIDKQKYLKKEDNNLIYYRKYFYHCPICNEQVCIVKQKLLG